MNFEEQLNNYADLIVHHGLNVQKEQDVFISSEVVHRDFVGRVVDSCYRAGARYVHVDLIDPYQLRRRILKTSEKEYLEFVPEFIPFRYEKMIPEASANLKIIGMEDPDYLADLDPEKVNQVQLSLSKSLKRFYEEGIGHSKVQWCVASAATPKWAQRIFPDLSEKEAYETLWEHLLMITRADKTDCLQQWKKHNSALHERAKRCTEMKIKTLHFTGPNTDLRVGLSKKAVFKGGTDQGPRASFEPNIPTEEVFTTPDCRMTNGKVQTTRPFFIHGKLIKDLYLEFEKGEITFFSASDGEETFKEYIQSDPGAKRLGEVALVGIDSPIFQTGKIYEEILLDENAACHIAVGFAYRFCIDGSETMSEEELEEIGCNISNVHTDMMISSENVDVNAECYNGSIVPLIKEGQWVIAPE